MPEQITKYPETTLQVLKDAGARCGEGAPLKILKQYPADRFCALPTGETCIYGINEIPKMTQVTPVEMAKFVCHTTASASQDYGAAALVLGVGMVIGGIARRFRH